MSQPFDNNSDKNKHKIYGANDLRSGRETVSW